ncbi:MAG: DoxX family protein [Cyclobacteriaceae bacterium]|nr:DoxX family protein [Cyclobacteriaceae bacterium]
MKRDKIIYWIVTGLVAAGMALSGIMYLTNEEMKVNFTQIGFPLYFMRLLGIAKLLGAVALLAPVPANVKEWAYAGFGFTFIGAAWTHVATQTPWVAPVIFLLLLTVSYFFYKKVKAV